MIFGQQQKKMFSLSTNFFPVLVLYTFELTKTSSFCNVDTSSSKISFEKFSLCSNNWPKLSKVQGDCIFSGKSRNTPEEDAVLKEYTWEEIKKHAPNGPEKDKIWMVLYGRVYDLTDFMANHPGGDSVLSDISGQDASAEFETRLHSEKARKMAKEYLVGKVKGEKLGDLFEETDKAKKWTTDPSESQSGAFTFNLILGIFGIAILALTAYNYLAPQQ
ncbi:hypothetical protein RFI_30747 [Reticulomyxa filosa]|uniref:Cytochrome b5 heme-binding domain-containing protein n=1 Tax=Reticulomyxa filosa TaxID=46433 RepID=X6M0Y9_RETFI|nr:hypothetical protein RFI_30747 [Reticulomyxa filosa]|eukprot:ETO06645.1 hypothetical protein RFI_30747 [Reticulomyxa filosa]